MSHEWIRKKTSSSRLPARGETFSHFPLHFFFSSSFPPYAPSFHFCIESLQSRHYQPCMYRVQGLCKEGNKTLFDQGLDPFWKVRRGGEHSGAKGKGTTGQRLRGALADPGTHSELQARGISQKDVLILGSLQLSVLARPLLDQGLTFGLCVPAGAFKRTSHSIPRPLPPLESHGQPEERLVSSYQPRLSITG